MITKRDKKFYALALKIAELSDCKQRHGAIIVDGSRIISLAPNKLRSNPTSDKWKLAIDQKRTSHAEQRCLILARADVGGMTLYSARLNGSGKSNCCPMCRDLMQLAGIARIVYSDGVQLIKEKL